MVRPGNRPFSPAIARPQALGNRVPGALYSDGISLARTAATTVLAASTAAVTGEALVVIEDSITDLEGALPAEGVQVVTANYSMTPDDWMVLADASAGPITVTLPNAATGGEAIVKKVDASVNAVTVDGLGAQQIDGAANVVLATQNETVRAVSDGTLDWYSA